MVLTRHMEGGENLDGNGREFFSLKEIAAKLGFTEKTIRKFASKPALRRRLPPFVRFGTGRIKFPIDGYRHWKENI